MIHEFKSIHNFFIIIFLFIPLHWIRWVPTTHHHCITSPLIWFFCILAIDWVLTISNDLSSCKNSSVKLTKVTSNYCMFAAMLETEFWMNTYLWTISTHNNFSFPYFSIKSINKFQMILSNKKTHCNFWDDCKCSTHTLKFK